MPPAYARIDPCGHPSGNLPAGALRVRADQPEYARESTLHGKCTPRTRGSTRLVVRHQESGSVPPAYARIDPGAPQSPTTDRSASRVRADRPRYVIPPAPTPPCLPRTRGSTRRRLHGGDRRPVPPAYARIDPSRSGARTPLPRAPRVRADRPSAGQNSTIAPRCPPRTRGSTLAGSVGEVLTLVPPAYARIDRRRHPVGHHPPSAPRVRADRPSAESRRRYLDQCPPRTRGWTLHQRRIVAWDQVPPRTRGSTAQHAVHVGQYRVPPRTRGSTRGTTRTPRRGCRAPRVRADRPPFANLVPNFTMCHPRTRGSTEPVLRNTHGQERAPAYARIDPTRPG